VNALLVRVAADQSRAGGSWNGPVDSTSGDFAYVAIPEGLAIWPGLEKPYASLASTLAEFGVTLPDNLVDRHMHLDPDFARLTYGDVGQRAKQIRTGLGRGDLIVFYAGLRDTRGASRLVYAIIGLFEVDSFVPALEVRQKDRDLNAHSRRVLKPGADDLIICGRPGVSGRLQRCISIGEYRNRAYRTRVDLLEAWGGLSIRDGYLQRSARLPRFLDPMRFRRWFEKQGPALIQTNN
jgi:hypothetical protein